MKRIAERSPALEESTTPQQSELREPERADARRAARIALDQQVRERTAELTNANAALLDDIAGLVQTEAELREGQERYRELFDNAQDAIYVHDLKGNYIAANRAAERLTGYTHHEIIGRNFTEFMAPEDVARIRASLSQKLETKGSTTYEIEVLTKDGRRVPLEVSSRLIYQDGRPVGVQGMARDITERRRAEAERRALTEIVQAVLTSANLNELFTLSQQTIAKVISAQNCLVALYDKATDILQIPFFKDEFNPPPALQSLGRGLTSYVLRNGQPLSLAPERIQELLGSGEIEMVGTLPASWLGVPLRTSTDTIGVLVVQHYENRDAYSQRDLDLLTAVGDQLGMAIERKRIEIELKLNEVQLHEAQHIAKLGNWQWDAIADRVTWSTELYHIYGLQAQDFEANLEAFLARVHLDDQERVAAIITRALAEQVFPDHDYRLVRPDGTIRSVHANGRVIVADDGKVIRMWGTVQDITERKQVDERLRESEEKYRTILEQIEDGYCEIDLNGVHVFVNDSFCRITGYSASELLGKSYKKFCDPQLIPLLHQTYLNIYETGEPLKGFEYQVTRHDGHKIFVEESVTLKRDATGRPIGFMGIRRDCTERKLIEVQLVEARDVALASTRMKSQFLANMSHEIRTPMNGVIGMTGLLLDTNLTAEQKDYTETINSSAEALMTVINDILDFSKIEAGKLHFEKRDFNLLPTIEAVVELLAERAHAKRLEIASVIEDEVPTRLCGDAGRLRQVLTNLIGNAVKFTEKGEVILRVKRVHDAPSETTLRFAISDTGIGVSDEVQRHLFQAFVQADGSATRKYGGTGLGLAISKQLVELMGGEIGIDSTPGAGSTFWFTARFEKQQGPAVILAPRRDLTGARILVVDDNETSRGIVVDRLTSWGMLPTSVPSGAEALALLRRAAARGAQFSLAILDMQMPGMDGLTLARAIKSDPEIKSTLLLLLTSLGQGGDRAWEQEKGIGRCLKPIKESQLFDSLATLMAIDQADLLGNAATELPVTAGPGAGATRAGRLLLAEDNWVNQRVALSQLQKLGYSADLVVDGVAVLAALQTTPYSVVLMDCQMPRLDGYETTAEIRRREVGTNRHTVIIAMTANAMAGEREKCLAVGMDDYLSKPVKELELAEMLKRWKTELSQSAAPPRSTLVAASAAPATRVLDPAVVESLRELQQVGRPDLICELIELYLKDAGLRFAELQGALDDQDLTRLQRASHSLRGGSNNLGISSIALRCTAFEQHLQKHGLGGVDALLEQLRVEFDRVSEALAAELQLA